MATDRTPGGSTRRMLAYLCMGLGALLLLVMPLTLLFFAVNSTKDPHLQGTLVILTSVGGMALLALGAVLRD